MEWTITVFLWTCVALLCVHVAWGLDEIARLTWACLCWASRVGGPKIQEDLTRDVHVAVLVNGDIGQSPRTLHHAEMLAKWSFRPSVSPSQFGAESDADLDEAGATVLSKGYYEGGAISQQGAVPRSSTRVTVFAYGDPPKSLVQTEPGMPHPQFPTQGQTSPQVTFRKIHARTRVRRDHGSAVYFITSVLATVSRALDLIEALWTCRPRLDALIMQNPPSIPSLLIALVFARLRHGALVVVDWHNFGYTILRTTRAPSLLLVLAEWYESTLAPYADAHLCVSTAMCEFLRDEWNVDATVYYDMPHCVFRPVSVEEEHDLFLRLEQEYSLPIATERGSYPVSCTLRTSCGERNQHTTRRSDRPFLCVSSTSWTPDEDFELLFDALVELDKSLLQMSYSNTRTGETQVSNLERSLVSPPQLLFVITGRGPLRAAFEARIARADLRCILVVCAWLSKQDYAHLLGSADVGVCLHSSSSGLDLPMKAVDMLGAGLPVIAVDYGCITELIVPGKSGLLVRGADELASTILDLMDGFPKGKKRIGSEKGFGSLQVMREWIRAKYGSLDQRADSEWCRVVAPKLNTLLDLSEDLPDPPSKFSL
ncbi:UDP-glycosyltransferase TURAN [Porphyridium purpureum]|uniref:UDP-glycosyltransferase TURAN n=1 Tax=Porphyridium purpureum TaxID=35688 RepID=A0A5J4YWU8_PORPP|nr:UDP-glycosyltransferase TURAN [Porphyridium purpureum]|eukprot:POR0445..scf209_3